MQILDSSFVNGIKFMYNIYHRLARPVKLAVIGVAFALEEIREDFP